uniref:FXYD domain-containing ion transport regulator n=1 Tax=Oryzias latipes TaxID=8090 RepID=A0A3P9H2I2_ORYLA
MATTEIMFPDQSDFEYDYETLRTTGVTLAVVLFVAGIFIALNPIPMVPKFQKQKFPLQLYENHNASLQEERCIHRVYTTNYAPAALWQFFHRLILVCRLDYLSPGTFILS